MPARSTFRAAEVQDRSHLRIYQHDPQSFARRFVPALFLAVFVTACGGSTSTPAVDATQLKTRLDQFVAAVTKPSADPEFTAKAEGGATVETKDDGTVIGTLPRGNFEGANILHLPRTIDAVAQRTRVEIERIGEALDRARAILFAARETRVHPGRDSR